MSIPTVYYKLQVLISYISIEYSVVFSLFFKLLFFPEFRIVVGTSI